MKEFLELGSAPTDENSVQVSNSDYVVEMRSECQRYKDLLEKKFPNIPESCSFALRSFPHDFGYYIEVVIYYDINIKSSVEFAFKVEEHLPKTWK